MLGARRARPRMVARGVSTTTQSSGPMSRAAAVVGTECGGVRSRSIGMAVRVVGRPVPAERIRSLIRLPDRHEVPPAVARRHRQVLRPAAPPVPNVKGLGRRPAVRAEGRRPGSASARPRGHRSSRRESATGGRWRRARWAGVIEGSGTRLDTLESRDSPTGTCLRRFAACADLSSAGARVLRKSFAHAAHAARTDVGRAPR